MNSNSDHASNYDFFGAIALKNGGRGDYTETEIKTCSVCGEETKVLYQQNMCKKCLLLSFKKLVKLIDDFRGNPRAEA